MKKSKIILVAFLILSMVFSQNLNLAMAETLYLSINKPLEQSVLVDDGCNCGNCSCDTCDGRTDCHDCLECEECSKEYTQRLDLRQVSTVRLLGINYTKRTIDVTYLAMGDDVGHDHVYETKYDSNQHWKECIICQKKTDIQNHSYSEAWTMGDSCAQSNKLVHACSCGYSYQTPNTRAHRDVRGCVSESNTYHTVNQCFYCRDKADAYSEIHYNAGGQLGCSTGRSGTCSACGAYIDGTQHEAWLNPNVTNEVGNHDEKHVQDASCVKCGKTLVSDYWADISYNGTRMYYTLRVRYNWNISAAQSFSAGSGFYPGNSGTVYNSSHSINGNEVTYHIEAEMPANYEKSTCLYYNPTVTTADGTRFTIHQDSTVIPEKTTPQNTNVVQVDVTSQDDWATAKRITISGTENYCTYVNITVKDEEGNVYADNAKALVNGGSYSYSFIPRVEADANGKVLTAYITDSLGNQTTKQFTIYKIDNYAPKIVGDLETSTEWSRSKDFTYHATDGGIKEVKIGFGEESEEQLADEVNGVFEREYTFVGDVYGTTVTRVYATDGLGNGATAYVKISNLDNTAPTVTNASKQLVLLTDDSKVDITATANDMNTALNAEGSGVVAYMITDSTTKPEENDSRWQESNVLSVTENGTYYIWAKDAVGNVSNYKQIDVTELMSAYTVNHYLMDVNGTTYTLKDTENLTAKTNTKVTPDVKFYEGFTAPETETKNIASDGSTVFNYYYTRNQYYVKLVTDDGIESLVGEGLYYYEDVIQIDANVKDDYVWDKWTMNEETTEKNHTVTIPAYSIVYQANTLKKCDVTTHYVDFFTNENIAEDDVQHKIQKDEYTTPQIDIDGYTYYESQGETEGTIGINDIEVIYYYKKNSSITAQYEDYYTHDVISSEVVKNGQEGDAYSTEKKDIDGYLYFETQGVSAGLLQHEPTVVKYLYKKISTVTVRYVDAATGREIADEINTKYVENANYETGRRTIAGYTWVADSGNTSGVMGRSDIVVTYLYNANTSVNVRYIDVNTNTDIEASEEIRGKEGDTYTTTQKDISGYRFVGVDGQTSGTMSAAGTTVTYKYEKLSKVYVYYVDETSNTSLYSVEPTTYSQGASYSTVKVDITGYTYSQDSGNTTGTVGRDNIYVTYYYKKNTGYTVKYLDYYTREPLVPDVEIPGVDRQPYTTEQKDIEGYEFAEVIGLPSGLMDAEPQTITYRYKKLSNLIVHHIDANTGEQLHEDTITTYRQKDKYEANPVNIPGYVLVESPEVTTGKVDREDIEKTYYYKEISNGLIVKYVDIKTNEVLDQLTFTGNVNDEIEIEYKPIIQYYRVDDSRPDKEIVVLTNEPQEVIYEYVRRSEVVFRGIDQDTGEVLYEAVLDDTGVEGETYEVNPRVVNGYTLVKIPENARGTYSRNNPVVVFEYKKDAGTVEVKYVEKATGELLDSKTLTGSYGTTYTTQNKEITGYRFLEVVGQTTGVFEVTSKEVTYYYERISSTVTLKYIDEDGNQLDAESKSGNMGDTYNFTLKEINGYEVVDTPALSGTFSDTDLTLIVKLKKVEEPVATGTIIVNLLDKNGRKIGESIVKTDEVGQTITINLPEIEGYRIVGDSTITATFVNGELVYDIRYEKIPETVYSNITVKFEDENGNQIRPAQTSRAEVGKAFTFAAPQIEGYNIVENANINTTYTEQDQTFTIKYQAIPQIKYGTIVVKFVDENGNEIRGSKTTRDEVGKEFTYDVPEIEGYTINGQTTLTATFTEEEQILTATYTKNQEPEIEYGKIIVKYVDEDGNEIKPAKTYTGEVGKTFTATAPEIDGYELVGNKQLTDTYVTGEKTLTVSYKLVETPVDPGHKDDPVEPEKPEEKTAEEKTVDTGDINLYGLLAMALGSVLIIKKEIKKSLEK